MREGKGHREGDDDDDDDDDDDAPGGRVDVILDGARFELDMRQCRAVVEGFPPGSSSDEGSECGSMMKHDDEDDDDDARPPPYVSCVFSHVTLNLYRPRGTTGGAKERDAVRAMRRALERARAVAWSDWKINASPATKRDEIGWAGWTTPPQWRVGAGILCDAVLGVVPVGEEGAR